MKNKKIWLGVIILIFVFILSSCGLFDDDVPSWAIGKWYMIESVGVLDPLRPEAAEITKKEFIPKGIVDNIPLIKRTDVTLVTANKVYFDLIVVSKGSSGEIEVSFTGVPQSITLYK